MKLVYIKFKFFSLIRNLKHIYIIINLIFFWIRLTKINNLMLKKNIKKIYLN